MGTLLTPDLQATARPYLEALQLQILDRSPLNSELAQAWGRYELAGTPSLVMGNTLGEAWLRIIEDPAMAVAPPFQRQGWLSMEISVKDVDSLYEAVESSTFEIIGKPANLDISDDIRAMQVVGAAGEVLYLTQIKAAVPGFELPLARCDVDRLFIPVLLVSDRDQALPFYEQFTQSAGSRFETKISVINQACEFEPDTRHPVATLQLQGRSLIEIDQLATLQPNTNTPERWPAGIAMISFEVDDFSTVDVLREAEAYTVDCPPYHGRKSCLLTGTAGERIELVERSRPQP